MLSECEKGGCLLSVGVASPAACLVNQPWFSSVRVFRIVSGGYLEMSYVRMYRGKGDPFINGTNILRGRSGP